MNEQALRPPTATRKLRAFRIAAAALALGLIGAWLLPHVRWPESWGYAVTQFACSLVAAVIFVIGIRAFAEHGNYRLLLLGLAFLSFGVLDLLHAISAPGDPTFLYVSGENLSLWFWACSRIVGSALLLLSVIVPSSRGRETDAGRHVGWWLLLAGGALVVIAFAVPLIATVAPSLWEPRRGLTTFKQALEAVAVLLQGVIAVAYLRLWQERRRDVLLVFALGMLSLALAGLAVIAQREFYDLPFWLGGAYRLIAYLCFAAGLWLLIRPAWRAPRGDERLRRGDG